MSTTPSALYPPDPNAPQPVQPKSGFWGVLKNSVLPAISQAGNALGTLYGSPAVRQGTQALHEQGIQQQELNRQRAYDVPGLASANTNAAFESGSLPDRLAAIHTATQKAEKDFNLQPGTFSKKLAQMAAEEGVKETAGIEALSNLAKPQANSAQPTTPPAGQPSTPAPNSQIPSALNPVLSRPAGETDALPAGMTMNPGAQQPNVSQTAPTNIAEAAKPSTSAPQPPSVSDLASLALQKKFWFPGMRPTLINRGVTGDKVPATASTMTGDPVNQKGLYDIFREPSTGRLWASPSGVGSELQQGNLGMIPAKQEQATALADYYKGRASMIPLQAQKIVQDMQLNPERVEISRANSLGRWFGPTSASRQSSQFGADVEDKIDPVEQSISKLAQSGKIDPFVGRWQNFLAKDVRAYNDPDVSNLRMQMDVLSKAIMKMHGFRKAEEADKLLAQGLNVGSSPEDLFGSLEGLRTSARTYETMGQLPPEVQQSMMSAFAPGKNIAPKGTERANTPSSSAANPSSAPAGGGAPTRNVGDVVSIGGKQMKITAVHPDGSFDAR